MQKKAKTKGDKGQGKDASQHKDRQLQEQQQVLAWHEWIEEPCSRRHPAHHVPESSGSG